MKNKILSQFSYIIVLTTIILSLVGCFRGISTTVPNLSTYIPTPSYIHYTPITTSIIQLEFDYPSYWLFSAEEKYADTNTYSLGLIDQRVINVLTPPPSDSFLSTSSDYGRILIYAFPFSTAQDLFTEIEDFKYGHSDLSWINIQNEYHFFLDGYDAYVLEYLIEPFADNGYSSTMFERDIFFMVEDQYYYRIKYLIAESERGGKFEQGYEYFFQSLKVISD